MTLYRMLYTINHPECTRHVLNIYRHYVKALVKINNSNLPFLYKLWIKAEIEEMCMHLVHVYCGKDT